MEERKKKTSKIVKKIKSRNHDCFVELPFLKQHKDDLLAYLFILLLFLFFLYL